MRRAINSPWTWNSEMLNEETGDYYPLARQRKRFLATRGYPTKLHTNGRTAVVLPAPIFLEEKRVLMEMRAFMDDASETLWKKQGLPMPKDHPHYRPKRQRRSA